MKGDYNKGQGKLQNMEHYVKNLETNASRLNRNCSTKSVQNDRASNVSHIRLKE